MPGGRAGTTHAEALLISGSKPSGANDASSRSLVSLGPVSSVVYVAALAVLSILFRYCIVLKSGG